MDEPRLLPSSVAKRFQHAVDMTVDAGPALHGQTGRLVEDQNMPVLVEHIRLQHVAIVPVAHCCRAQRLRLALVAGLQRRYAHRLAGGDTRRGLHPPAVDADLARPHQFLQMRKAEARIMQLEPAVEPHAGLVGVNLYRLHAAHISARPSARPARSPASDRTTEPMT